MEPWSAQSQILSRNAIVLNSLAFFGGGEDFVATCTQQKPVQSAQRGRFLLFLCWFHVRVWSDDQCRVIHIMLKLSAEGRAAEGAMASCSCRWRQIFSGIILRSNVKILLLVWRKKYCLWLQHQQLETLKRANRILRPKYMLRERIMVWWFADVNFLSGLIFLRSIKLIFLYRQQCMCQRL